jgi:hypothetical protein
MRSISILSDDVAMPAEQRLVRLPGDLLRRFKLTVPTHSEAHSCVSCRRKHCCLRMTTNDPLYLAALAAERDTLLSAEMAEWEETMIGDGLEDLPSFQTPG